jgi:DNA mismatch repair protein MLH1
VGFLNEEEIIEKICSAVQKRLGEGDSSRRFTVQTLLPGVTKPIEAAVPEDKGKKPYDNYLIRTDPQTRKITTMLVSQSNVPENQSMEVDYETISKDRVPIKLGSVKELRDEVMQVAHNGISWHSLLIAELTELFANHTFVGVLDDWRRLAAIQHGVKLYLVDYGALLYALPIPN